MDTYATTLSSGVLAVMSLVSLGFVPFTEQYARESVPLQDWEEPAFRRTNQVLTLMWALVFALIALLGLLSAQIPHTRDWTNYVIPVVVIVGAVGMTHAYPQRAGNVRGRLSDSQQLKRAPISGGGDTCSRQPNGSIPASLNRAADWWA